MFRVGKEEQSASTLVTLDGRLSADAVEVVETCCGQAALRGKPVWLYLRDVSSVDPAVCVLLRRLAAKGVRLMGSGVYTQYLLGVLNSPAGGTRGGSKTSFK